MDEAYHAFWRMIKSTTFPEPTVFPGQIAKYGVRLSQLKVAIIKDRQLTKFLLHINTTSIITSDLNFS